jgi:hypothetical protein
MQYRIAANRAVIVTALAGQHLMRDIKRALALLSVVGRLDLQGSRYTLPAPEAELISSASSASRSVRRQSRKT